MNGRGPGEARTKQMIMENTVNADSRQAALAAYDRFFAGFNARDAEAWAEALAFPHVRVSHRGPVEVVATAEDYIAATSWERVEGTGWDHTRALEPRVIHEGGDRVHIAGGWTRFNSQNEPILSNLVTYVITQSAGHWGVQARFGIDPAGSNPAESGHTPAQAAVRAYLDDWNSERFEDAAARLNYPYVRVDPGRVTTWQTAAEHREWLDKQPWRAIEATDVRVVQAGHAAVTFALRLTDAAQPRDCLLLTTLRNGHWGVQAESTYPAAG